MVAHPPHPPARRLAARSWPCCWRPRWRFCAHDAWWPAMPRPRDWWSAAAAWRCTWDCAGGCRAPRAALRRRWRGAAVWWHASQTGFAMELAGHGRLPRAAGAQVVCVRCRHRRAAAGAHAARCSSAPPARAIHPMRTVFLRETWRGRRWPLHTQCWPWATATTRTSAPSATASTSGCASAARVHCSTSPKWTTATPARCATGSTTWPRPPAQWRCPTGPRRATRAGPWPNATCSTRAARAVLRSTWCCARHRAPHRKSAGRRHRAEVGPRNAPAAVEGCSRRPDSTAMPWSGSVAGNHAARGAGRRHLPDPATLPARPQAVADLLQPLPHREY